MRIKPVLAAAALAAVAAAPATSASEPATAAKPPKKTVRVGDNFFSPARMTVRPGTVITWVWPKIAGDVHDVYLASKPKGVKRFHSALAGSDYRFRRTLKKVGRYRMVCTIHAEMTMSVRVKRPRR